MNELWRPADRAFIQNPYPVYALLREHDPVHKSIHGEWIITKAKHVKSLLKDPRCIVGNRVSWINEIEAGRPESSREFGSLLEALSSFLVFKNPPDHTAMRKWMTNAWSNREVQSVIQQNIQKLARAVSWNDFDFITAFAEPLPALTMSAILGIPDAEHNHILKLSHRMIRSLDMYLTLRDLRGIKEATEEMAQLFDGVVRFKKQHPDQSLISNLCENHHYSIRDVSNAALFLFISGEETTSSLISMGLKHLLQHPQKWQQLICEPGNLHAAIDELIRFDTPLQIIARMANEDIQLEDWFLPAGSRITLCLGSANRDGELFENPDELTFERDNLNQHLSFATGIHRCLGDWLAKAEAVEMFTYLIKRKANLQMITEPEYRNNITLRSLTELRLTESPEV